MLSEQGSITKEGLNKKERTSNERKRRKEKKREGKRRKGKKREVHHKNLCELPIIFASYLVRTLPLIYGVC